MDAKRVLFNASTFIPGVTSIPVVRRHLAKRSMGTGGTNQARYCYSVWLRHLVSAHANGLNDTPLTVAELGPGDSVGIGLCAILTGAERYCAFDLVAHANAIRNLSVLDELIELLRTRARIPDSTEYPDVEPRIFDYSFPSKILPDSRLIASLQPNRLERIRDALRDCASPNSMIQYRAPWNVEGAIEYNSLDLVFSQAVLEHVDELPQVYRAIYLWLKPDAYMSHQIDYKCHDTAAEWNGHWTYSDLMWKLARGKDSWLINREPHSTHMRLMRGCGFNIVEARTGRQASKISRSQLAPRFRSITDEDLTTTDAFVQAVKPRT